MAASELEISAAVAASSDSPFATETLTLDAPSPGEVRVRIVATSVCHTDIMTKGKGLCAFPIVLGHEGVGVVDAIGHEVSDLEVGDHVILTYASCGHCPQCEQGKPSYCDDHGSLNFAGTRPDGRLTHRRAGTSTAEVYGSFFQQSSFATYALADPRNAIRVDKTLPLTTLAPLGCGVQTGAGTVLNTLEVEAGSVLAVYGCGCVGLSAIMAAKTVGAGRVIAIDINPARLRLAEELGATHTLLPGDFDSAESMTERVREISGVGGSHYAIDTTGVSAVLRQAFDGCRPMGVTAMIAPGVPGTEVSIEMLGLLPGKSLRGVVQGDAVPKTFIPTLIEMWQHGDFPFDRLITEFRGIDSVEEAVTAMEKGEVIKPVVIIDEGFAK